jgi:hypothetical protein
MAAILRDSEGSTHKLASASLGRMASNTCRAGALIVTVWQSPGFGVRAVGSFRPQDQRASTAANPVRRYRFSRQMLGCQLSLGLICQGSPSLLAFERRPGDTPIHHSTADVARDRSKINTAVPAATNPMWIYFCRSRRLLRSAALSLRTKSIGLFAP